MARAFFGRRCLLSCLGYRCCHAQAGVVVVVVAGVFVSHSLGAVYFMAVIATGCVLNRFVCLCVHAVVMMWCTLFCFWAGRPALVVALCGTVSVVCVACASSTCSLFRHTALFFLQPSLACCARVCLCACRHDLVHAVCADRPDLVGLTWLFLCICVVFMVMSLFCSEQAVPIPAYKAAVKALDGPDCSVALEMAREARSKLGDSAEVMLSVQERGRRCFLSSSSA